MAASAAADLAMFEESVACWPISPLLHRKRCSVEAAVLADINITPKIKKELLEMIPQASMEDLRVIEGTLWKLDVEMVETAAAEAGENVDRTSQIECSNSGCQLGSSGVAWLA